MKKLIVGALSMAMALSLVACGGGSKASSGSDAKSTSASADTKKGDPTKMTLILRGGTYAEVLKQAIPQFESDNNVKIEVQELSFDDLHTGIALDATNSKGTYDLCMVDGSWMAEFTENKVLANLTEMGYKFDDDIIEGTTSICKVGNDAYLAPFFGNVTVMLYNKALAEAAGYKGNDIKTFDDVMKIAKKTKESGKDGFLIRGGSPDNIVSDFIPHLLAHGGWLVDDNNKPTVDTPEFKSAMEEYLALYKLGKTMDKDDMVAAIDSGSAALGIGWPGWYLPTADSAGNYTVIPTMVKSGDKAQNTSMYGTWCIGIPNNAPNKDLALKLLEYVMSPEVQLKSVEVGGVPCRTSVLMNKDVLAKYPQYEIVCEALKSGVYRPVIAQWTQFTQILGVEMDGIIQGNKTIDKGLAEAQKQLDDLLK